MEISKGLQKEIVLVQNKLKNAICDHQICMGKLKDDPNNADIRGQIQQIQLNIVSLGRCQKQVVERLRKEVEGYQAQNDKGVKLSVASLLGLTNNNNNINNNNHASSNNNNHFTPNNDQDKDDVLQVKVQANGLAKRRRLNKDNFRNGVNKKIRAKETPVETLSIDDDVIELSNEENDNNEKEENTINENDLKTPVDKSELQQTEFLDKLGLITISNFDKLQSKKAERKRRSRANPQFVCSTWELPTKKKRHSYLQSGNAPQTRQTTARLNGPSPPPPPTATSSGHKVQKSQPVTKSVAGSPPPSPSSSSSSQSSSSKSLLPAQKPSGKPNILRNLNETLAHGGCNKTVENCSKSQTITSNSNSVKTSPSKVMNIPGLPSSLTIEKIENDVVCIHCRSPGMLSICENCSANYHPACHVILPPPQGQCPKCYEMNQDNEVASPVIKKSDEIGPAPIETRAAEQAGEDTEVNKETGGFHKIDATTPTFNSNFGVQQLPPSIQLIPIGSGPLSSTNITQSNHSLFAGPLNISNNFIGGPSNENAVTYSPVIINQFPSQQPCIGPYMQPDPRLTYNYGVPIVSPSDHHHHHHHHHHQQQHHHHQQHHQHQQQHQQQQPHSFLIIKKLSDPCVGGLVTRYPTQSSCPSTIGYSLPISSGPAIVSYASQQPGQPIINYSIGTIDPGTSASQQLLTSSASGIPIASPQAGVAIYDQRLAEGHPGIFYEQFSASRLITEPQRPNRQPTSRAVPRLNRIAVFESQNTSTKNPSAPAGPANRKRRKHYVRKNRNKKQRGAVEGASDKCDKSRSTSGVQPGTEPADNASPADNLAEDRQPRDLDIQPGSIVERLYRRLAEGQEPAEPHSPAKGLSSERADRDEHLKLEEAHLSAPLAANLVSSLSSDRPHSCPTVKGEKSLYVGKVDPNNKENDNKNENEQGCKVVQVSRPGRRSLDSLQADLTNTCRLWTPVRNQDNFTQETDKDFEPPSAEDTLTGDENDDPESGRLEIELADEEEEDEASDSPDNIDEEAIVSSIDMTVLEDFESAMRAEECGAAGSLLES